MENNSRELNWDQFEEEFRPIKNPFDDDASIDGCMLETYGAELEHVRKRAEEAPGTVWTFMEDGSGGTLIGEGLQFVNRLGYVLTEVPAAEGVQYVVDHAPVTPEFTITLTDANGVSGTIWGELVGEKVTSSEIAWDHKDLAEYESAHTVSATFSCDNSESREFSISGDAWRSLESAGMLDEFITKFVRSAAPKDDFWLRAAVTAAEQGNNELNGNVIASESIRLGFVENGGHASDAYEAMDRLMNECGDLFDSVDTAFAFLVERSPLSESEKEAIEAFRASKGRMWKTALGACWERSHYPGMTVDHAAALQRLRNTHGPEWLSKFRVAPVDTEVVAAASPAAEDEPARPRPPRPRC